MEEDNFVRVKKILIESTEILCENLQPIDLLRSLKSKNALKPSDVTKIKRQTTTEDQVDTLLEILQKKPVSAYDLFMETLQEERSDLYEQVKVIEAKHNYNGASAESQTTPCQGQPACTEMDASAEFHTMPGQEQAAFTEKDASAESHTTPGQGQAAQAEMDASAESHTTLCHEQDALTEMDASAEFHTTPCQGQAALTEMDASAEFHATPCQNQAALTEETHSVQQWRKVKQFGTEGNKQGEFKFARGIALSINNDITVTDFDLERVYVFSKDCQYTFTLVSSQSNPKTKLLYPSDVAVTSLGHIAVVDQSQYVKLFDVNGSYLHSLCTLSDDEPDPKVTPHSIAAASDGNLLVGDIRRNLVTIHAGSDGGLVKQINFNIKPHYLVANSRHEIFACDWQARQIVCVDYAGNELFRLNTFMVDGEKGLPGGLTCGDDDTIYLTVKKVNTNTGGEFANTGHIHQYSSSGRFMRCLIKGLYAPRDITWHNGFLYVSNYNSVIILGRSPLK